MNAETENGLNLSTAVSSIAMLVIGAVKSIDWVMVASVLLPAIIALINIVAKRKELKLADVRIAIEEERLRQLKCGAVETKDLNKTEETVAEK